MEDPGCAALPLIQTCRYGISSGEFGKMASHVLCQAGQTQRCLEGCADGQTPDHAIASLQDSMDGKAHLCVPFNTYIP